MNIPAYMAMNLTATIEIQSLIREALFGDDDNAAMALDALLAGKPEALRLTALVVAHRLRPYEVKS